MEVFLQGANLSLADCAMSVLSAWGTYCLDHICLVDENGWILDNAGKKVSVLLREVDKSVAAFFDVLGRGIEARMIDAGLMTEAFLVSLALDPSAFCKLQFFASLPGRFGAKCTLLLTKVEKTEQGIVKKMVLVAKAAAPKAAAAAPAVVGRSAAPEDLYEQFVRVGVASSETVDDEAALVAAAKENWAAFKIRRCAQDLGRPNSTEFWTLQYNTYPLLYHVFLQSKSARGTTAPVESAFSYAKNVVPSHRHNLTGKSVNTLLTIATSDLSKIDLWNLANTIHNERVTADRAARLVARAGRETEARRETEASRESQASQNDQNEDDLEGEDQDASQDKEVHEWPPFLLSVFDGTTVDDEVEVEEGDDSL